MARRLAGFVHVRDEQGAPHVFGPADDVPAWAEARISNPAAWADGAALPTASSTQTHPVTPRTEVQPTPEAQAAVQGGPPPQAGRGSSTSAWRDYAQRHGVSVPADADRGDIIDACARAGVPVE